MNLVTRKQWWEDRQYPVCVDWPTLVGEYRTWTWDDPMSVWHNFRCGMCGADQDGRRLHRDHDHNTGLVRGLLCSGCNSGEWTRFGQQGIIWDNWRNGVNTAEILGIQEWYEPPRMMIRGGIVEPWPFDAWMLEHIEWIAPELALKV